MSDVGGQDALRIGTQEREDAVRILGEHFAAGRLPIGEYEQRVTDALTAQTRGELRQLFGDLPTPHPPSIAAPVVPIVTVQPYPYPAPPPYPQVVYSDKSRLVAGLLQIVLPFGAGRFYTGHIGMAVGQLITSLFFIGIIWSFIDGIILLAAGGTDSYGRRLRNT